MTPSPRPARRAFVARRAAVVEWPTVLLAATVHGVWFAAAAAAGTVGQPIACVLLTLATCWYMSLQHELLHGHPTRCKTLNRLIELAPLAVWYPYDLYRASHLARHRDEVLTQPGLDPESPPRTASPSTRRGCSGAGCI